MIEDNTDTDTEVQEQEAKEDDGLTPGAITRQAPPSLMDQIAAQEVAQKEASKKEEGAESDEGAEGSQEQDDSEQTDNDEGTGTHDKEKDAEGTDKDDEGAQSESMKRRLGQQRDKARKDSKNSAQRASYWEQRALGKQFTPEEAAAAGQSFEVWPPPTVETQKIEPTTAAKTDDTKEDDTDKEPNQEEYDDHDAYIDARGAWSARREFRRMQKEQGERAKKQEQDTKNREAAGVWSDRLDAARRRHPDMDEILHTADPGPMERSPVIMQVMAESEVGADLLYMLAKDADEMRRIASLSVKDQVIAVDALEKKVLAEIQGGEGTTQEIKKKEGKPPGPVSGAPKPPLKTGSTSGAGGPAKLSDAAIRERLAKGNIDYPRTPRG